MTHLVILGQVLWEIEFENAKSASSPKWPYSVHITLCKFCQFQEFSGHIGPITRNGQLSGDVTNLKGQYQRFPSKYLRPFKVYSFHVSHFADSGAFKVDAQQKNNWLAEVKTKIWPHSQRTLIQLIFFFVQIESYFVQYLTSAVYISSFLATLVALHFTPVSK